MHLSQIFIYPIKSLGGIQLDSSEVTDIGLKNDRLWMIVDQNNTFITQREYPFLSQFKVELAKDVLSIIDLRDGDRISFDTQVVLEQDITVEVWSDKCKAHVVSEEVNHWLSEKCGIVCSLVKLAPDHKRAVDRTYAPEGSTTTFTDGFPFLIIGQSSLDLLNSKLDQPVSMKRFRPNFVFTGGQAHCEDQMGKWRIGKSTFTAVKLCSRCIVTTIDLKTAKTGKEPLKTLARYRNFDKRILFGQNMIYKEGTIVCVGDKIEKVD